MEAYSREPKEEGLLRIIKNKIITPENFQMILYYCQPRSRRQEVIVHGQFWADYGNFFLNLITGTFDIHGLFSLKVFMGILQIHGNFFDSSRVHFHFSIHGHMLNIHKHLCENEHGYICEVYGKKQSGDVGHI